MCSRLCPLLVLTTSVFVALLLSGQLTRWGVWIYVANNLYYPEMVGGVPATLSPAELKRFSFSDIPDLSGRVSLVTGANVGLGYYTSLHLALHGSDVVMACRSLKKCDEAADNIRKNSKIGNVYTMELDLSSLSSVDKFGKKFIEKFHRLDFVIFNAGGLRANFALSTDGIEQTFAINHLGHFKLFLDLENLIVETSKNFGTVTLTHVSSAVSFAATRTYFTISELNNASSYDRAESYNYGKLCNILFSNEISQRMLEKKLNVLSNAVHPGLVDTNFAVEERSKLDSLILKYQADIFFYIRNMIAWTPEEGSLTQLFTATSSRIIDQKITGKYFHPIAKEVPTPRLVTPENSKLLWKFSLDLLHSKGHNLEEKK